MKSKVLFAFEVRTIAQAEFTTKYTEHLNRIAKHILQPDMILQELCLPAHQRENKNQSQRAPGIRRNTQEQIKTVAAHLKYSCKFRHRMCRHRMDRHRMSAQMEMPSAFPSVAPLKFWERKSRYQQMFFAQPSSTPQPMVRRELRPPFEGRCANQKSLEPIGTHSKRKHRRGRRSSVQKLIHKCNSRQKKAVHRREFRRVRSCWKALARRPALLSLAQEQILAETDTLELVDTEKQVTRRIFKKH